MGCLPPDRYANRLAPLADAPVTEAVNGLVGSFHRRDGERLGIDIARGRVKGEGDHALAAVYLHFGLVEEISETAPIPADVYMGAVDGRADIGLDGRSGRTRERSCLLLAAFRCTPSD